MVAKYLYRNILWRGLLQVSVFILNILLARHFQAAYSGQLFYLANLYSLMVLVASLSLESGITYFGVRNEISFEKLVNFSMLYSACTAAILYLVSLFVSNGEGDLSRQLFCSISISFVAGNLLYTYSTSLFTAKKDFVLPNIIAICINLLLILLMPGNGLTSESVISEGLYFQLYFYSFALLGVASIVLFLVKYIRIRSFALPSFASLKNLFRYSLTAWTGNLIFFLVYRIDYFFVQKYCDVKDVGNYIQVSKLGQLFFLLPTILAAVIFPITASGSRKNIIDLLAVISRVILFLYLIACIVLVIVGKWLFPAVFGESFNTMYPAFLYLIPGILALSMSYCITAYNAGLNKLRINLVSAFIALLVIVTGNISFINIYSINNAAAVSSLGYCTLLLYVLIKLKKEHPELNANFFVIRSGDFTTLKNIFRNNIKADR